MEYPTKLYPKPPQPEWFFKSASNLESVTTGQGAAFPQHVASEVKKMDLASYSEYLDAHNKWQVQVLSTETLEHERALKRRFLEKFREVPAMANQLPDEPPPPRVMTGLLAIGRHPMEVITQRKESHPPTLSTKEGKKEKRLARRMLNVEKTRVSSGLLQAKRDALVDTLPSKREVVRSSETIRTQMPLQVVDLAAQIQVAKSATLLSKVTPDHVQNVEKHSGAWTVVSRKKGEFTPSLSRVEERTDARGKTVNVYKDPSVPSSMVPKQAVRMPNAVSKN